ncbi:MAG: hypothetical protein HXX13_16590 [Bacteroidetes bacterium]|nr:hypothetical protein [Bacteroidota bacterium]
MKYLVLLFTLLAIIACDRPSDRRHELLSRIDSLEKKLAQSYKPGLGEFMSSIQTHHAKLWFAGQNQNWNLADFEVHEIMEAVDNIQKYDTERKESKLLEILSPSIDTVNMAIKKKDKTAFDRSFNLLTQTCNKCHQQVNFAFNVVKIPEVSTFSNQDFNLQNPADKNK